MKYQTLADLYEKLFATSKRLEKTYLISQFLKSIKSDYNILFLLLRGRIYPDWDETKIGFAARMALKALSASTGTPIKKIEYL
jgi:DNA ligase-1